MSEVTLYDQVLARVAGKSPVVSKPPRPSASVVLWRQRAGAVEVFWLERARTMAFMGGWHAFPGGGISRSDAAVDVVGEPAAWRDAPADGAMPESVTDGVEPLAPVLAPGVVAGALRELFEEVGVLPGLAANPEGHALRAELAARERSFPDVLGLLEHTLDASRLTYAGRWLTPPLGPIRFDNRFFLLEWPESEPLQPAADTSEAEGGEWIRPREALTRWQDGEVITAPPILHLLRVLGAEGPGPGLARLHRPVEADVGPFRWVEFRPGVVMFPVRTPTLPPAAFTNCFLLGAERCVIVDPGSPYERESEWLAQAFEHCRDVLGRELTEIWLTHHHPDHIGGVMALSDRLALPIAAHALTAQQVAGRVRVDRELHDGERIELGAEIGEFTVRVLHTPGHARGHLAFLHEQLGSLVAGDVVAGFGTIVIDPPEGDMDEYLDTLERLATLRPATLFPAHGAPTVDAVGKLEEYRRHRLWREGLIREAWQAGHREPAEIRPRVYEDLDPMAHPLAERQIVAHLDRLRAHGEIA